MSASITRSRGEPDASCLPGLAELGFLAMRASYSNSLNIAIPACRRKCGSRVRCYGGFITWSRHDAALVTGVRRTGQPMMPIDFRDDWQCSNPAQRAAFICLYDQDAASLGKGHELSMLDKRNNVIAIAPRGKCAS
jgi:hypothetical protein